MRLGLVRTERKMMIGQLIKSHDKRTFTVLVIALILFTIACSFYNDAPSAADELQSIKPCDREPTVDEKMMDLATSIVSIESARLSINGYTCKAKQKCKPVDYAQTLSNLKERAHWLSMAKLEQINSCKSMFGCSEEYCVEFSRDTHSALHIVEDLIRTITKKDKGPRYISSGENKVLRRYLDKLTVHQQHMKNALECLKDAAIKDKSRCDSLRPPKY
jgi:hypothetical protein